MARVIRGTFCEVEIRSKSSFDKRSFRWKKSGKSFVLIGCPKGKWNARTERCKVGTRAYKLLARAHGACRVGKRIKKGA